MANERFNDWFRTLDPVPLALALALGVRGGGGAFKPGHKVVGGGAVEGDGVAEEEVGDVGWVAVCGELVGYELRVGETVADYVCEEQDCAIGVGRGGGGGEADVGFDWGRGGVLVGDMGGGMWEGLIAVEMQR